MQAIARRRRLLYQGSLSSQSSLSSSRFLSLLFARHFFINSRKLGIVARKLILLFQSNKIHLFKLNLKLTNNNKVKDDNIVTTNSANSIKKLSVNNRYNQRQYLWHQSNKLSLNKQIPFTRNEKRKNFITNISITSNYLSKVQLLSTTTTTTTTTLSILSNKSKLGTTRTIETMPASKLSQLNDKLLLTPAHVLSGQIKAGSLTSEQLVCAYIDRLKLANPFINAVCEDNYDEAIGEAKRIDEALQRQRTSGICDDELALNSPLCGIPVSIKESIAVKGKRNSCGLFARRDSYAREDAILVAAVRRLGMIPIATSNVPEGTMYWADCRNPVYGRTLNPYDSSRITGASSGGEGALLGAGASLVGIGSDIGGSLRLPAHFCGIFSLKPSPWLLSSVGNYPSVKTFRLRLFTLGPMTRYASDLRPMLKAMIHGQRVEEMSRIEARSEEYGKAIELYTKKCRAAGEPENIAEIRKQVLHNLDESVDLSTLTVCYINFKDSSLRKTLGILPEILAYQDKIVESLKVRGCKVKQVNLDSMYKDALIAWQFLFRGAAAPGVRFSEPTNASNNNSNNAKKNLSQDNANNKEKDEHNNSNNNNNSKSNNNNKTVTNFKYTELDDFDVDTLDELCESNELKQLFDVDSIVLELGKLLIGASKHTVETLLMITSGMKVPSSRAKAESDGRHYEELVKNQRRELEAQLGESGVLIVPTMPNVAYKHTRSILRTNDLGFTALFNSLQLPVAQVPIGLLDKPRLPFGFSCAALPFKDHLALAIAEALESDFNGWKDPGSVVATIVTDVKAAASKAEVATSSSSPPAVQATSSHDSGSSEQPTIDNKPEAAVDIHEQPRAQEVSS